MSLGGTVSFTKENLRRLRGEMYALRFPIQHLYFVRKSRELLRLLEENIEIVWI